ncbi:MAG: alpha/beta hydrolase, partial [Pseudomonadota bacterium]
MSLQATIAKLMLKLPAGWKVKMAGGTPLVLGGRTLDPDLQFIAHGAANQPPMSSLEPEVAQAAAIEGLAMFAAKPEPGVTWADRLIPGPGTHQIPVRIYQPDDQDPNAPLLAYWHMGGGVILNIEACHAFCTM